MRELILGLLSQYGSPALFGVTAVASLGVPLPVTVLLIVAGSLAAQGIMPFWLTIVVATCGAVLGDQIGYGLGRWGGLALITRFGRFLGGAERIAKAEAHARQWGGPGVFFTRWLVTPLGSLVNLTSGATEYPWLRFVFWDVLGEAVGAALYVSLGRVFSDRVVELNAVLGDFSWMLLAMAATAVLGWLLLRLRRRS